MKLLVFVKNLNRDGFLKRLACGLLVGTMLVNTAGTAFATTSDELKKQQKELEKQKRELLELELDEAKLIIEQYKTNLDVLSIVSKPKGEVSIEKIQIDTPFNICILGEVSDQSQIRYELNSYFAKIGVATTDWNVDFIGNTKLENANVFKSLQKGQSKYDLIFVGQIHHHSGKGNQKANIITELKNKKYIPSIVGSSPKDVLTPDKLIDKLNDYLMKLSDKL